MIRISDILKNKDEGDDFPEEKKGKEETKHPSHTPYIQISKAFETKEMDEDLSRKLYDEAIIFVRDNFDKVDKGGLFEARSVIEIVERIVTQIEGPNRDLLLSLTASSPEGNFLYAHSVNVCILAVRLVKALAYSRQELIKLGVGALLHDIGMIRIPKEIVNSHRRLSKDKYKEIKKHPIIGYEILKEIKGLNESAAYVAYQHHERIDGSGYPRGIKDIHKYAKIVGLVNIYEALTHPRPWRERFLSDRAMEQILDVEKGSFDLDIVKTFLQEISIYSIGSWVELSTKEAGKVVSIDPSNSMKPTVKIIFDPNGTKLESPKAINLAEEPLIFVEKACKPR